MAGPRRDVKPSEHRPGLVKDMIDAWWFTEKWAVVGWELTDTETVFTAGPR